MLFYETYFTAYSNKKQSFGLRPGRYLHDNLRSLELIKQYCIQEKIKGLLVGVDARKAFDSVHHEYYEKYKKKSFGLGMWTGIV